MPGSSWARQYGDVIPYHTQMMQLWWDEKINQEISDKKRTLWLLLSTYFDDTTHTEDHQEMVVTLREHYYPDICDLIDTYSLDTKPRIWSDQTVANFDRMIQWYTEKRTLLDPPYYINLWTSAMFSSCLSVDMANPAQRRCITTIISKLYAFKKYDPVFARLSEVLKSLFLLDTMAKNISIECTDIGMDSCSFLVSLQSVTEWTGFDYELFIPKHLAKPFVDIWISDSISYADLLIPWGDDDPDEDLDDASDGEYDEEEDEGPDDLDSDDEDDED